MSGKRRKSLTTEDKELWSKVTEQVDPLVHSAAIADLPAALKPKAVAKKTKPKLSPFEIGAKFSGKTSPLTSIPSQAMPRTSPHMDKRNFDRLKRGKLEIDRTLDLHGMTSEQAKMALQSSLLAAHRSGARLILVITGKGNTKHTDEFNRPVSGVLRQKVPEWLRMSPLSGIVLQVIQSQQRHGGAGALYVYLKRQR